MEPPKVVPKKVKEWHTEQPEHEILPSIPARMALLGPSGSGKTQLIQAMCCDFFRRRGRSVFARIYIWSPSVLVDTVWEPVIKMCKTELGQDNDREQFLFQSYNPADLQRVIQTQKDVISRAKEAKLKTLFNILIIVDDFADRPDFTRTETLVWELFFRGRHAKISTLISTQKWKAISPAIRSQATALFVFRLRSQQELEAFAEEVSALVDKKTVMQFYREATEEPYSFLYVRLEAKKPEDIFWERFEHRLLP
jgi:GTPase SAR1 family protein